jgi:predicted amidohydrolase YtcJ
MGWMPRVSRRSFLQSSILSFVAGCASLRKRSLLGPQKGEGGAADTIVTGKLLTMDPRLPEAKAMAIRGGFILAVGDATHVQQWAGPNTRRIDAVGATVTPGFIDSHSHPLIFSESTGVNVEFSRISEVQAALKRKAAATPPDHWVVGIMYDDTKFVENRPLNRIDIDAVVPDRPVIVRHRGGHTAVVNSRAFELAGITMGTRDPTGGTFYRESGAFTGKIAERAIEPFQKAGIWPVDDRETRKQNVALISKRMAAAGLTSTTDALGDRDKFVAYQDARESGQMYFRVSFMPAGGGTVYQGLKAAGVRSGFGDDMLRIGAVKFLADGSASERTMHMSKPYRGRPDDYGILRMDQSQIDEAVQDAVASGFRVGIHANGDVAIDMTLNAYERVLKDWKGPNPRFRIEHCSLVNPALIARIKAAGVIPTPFYTYAYYHGEKWAEYGEVTMNWMFAHRSFLDAGIPVGPASDFTPGPFEPLMAIQSMVTRKDKTGRIWGPKQRISVDEALRICTMNGAYASFEENLKGSLTAGKLADFVILEHDPHDVDADRIMEIRVLRTVMGGGTTYEA